MLPQHSSVPPERPSVPLGRACLPPRTLPRAPRRCLQAACHPDTFSPISRRGPAPCVMTPQTASSPCKLRHGPAHCAMALHTAPRPCTLRHGPAACVMAPQTASSPCKLRHGPAHCVMNLQIASWPGVSRPPTTWLWGQEQSWVAGTRSAMTRTSIARPSHVPQSALRCCQSAQATCHQSATKPHATRAPQST